MASLQQEINEAFDKANKTFHNEESLVDKLKQIRNDALEIANYAHEYDLPGVPCNGYRTAIDIAVKFFKYGADNYDTSDQEYRRLVNFFVCGMKYFRRTREKTMNRITGNGAKELLDEDPYLACEGFSEYHDKKVMDGGHGPLTGFYYGLPERFASWMTYMAVGTFSTGNIWKTIQSVFDPDMRRENIRKTVTNFRIEYVKCIDIVGNSWYVRNISPFTVNWLRPNRRETIQVPRQRIFKLECDEEKQTVALVKKEGLGPKDNNVRCRLLYDDVTGKPPNGSIVLHVHGGGFVIGSPDCHEIYTRYWVNQMPGVPFISVDYDLSPETQFPEPLQQIIDVFFWLHTKEAEEVIGFKPTRIVCCGDSSGALLSLATIEVLNDIRKKWPEDVNFFMPSGLVGIYPSFCLSPRASPSLLLAALHPTLMPSAFLNMVTAYVPTRDLDMNNIVRRSCRKDMITRIDRIIKWLIPPSSDPIQIDRKSYVEEKYWWNQTVDVSRSHLDKWELLNHPYVSPLLYQDFKSLKDIQLSLLVCPTDPIVDQAVSLVNRWKGEVSLKTFDGMTHAFLPMIFLKGVYEEHNMSCVNEIKRLLRYPH